MLTDLDAVRRTLHFHSEDIPWVRSGSGTQIRVLHARPDEGFIATQFRAEPGAETGLHRHTAPVFGFTTLGRWGHDRRFAYHPGTYIFETPGVVHRFLNGPEPTEVFFVNLGDIEQVDPSGSCVVGRTTPRDTLLTYLERCESAGLARPNLLP
jgi:2,4'-dihydroxyacetophenone dioxygenase